MYEIVPVDPLSKLQKKHESLEDDIREIKAALRGTVGLSKLETNADQFIQRMLDLLSSSQKMVEEVAGSNQQVAARIQVAIDRMNKANEELASKLSQIVNLFAQATEAMAGEGSDSGSTSEISDSIANLTKSISEMNENSKRVAQVLDTIEKGTRRQAARPMMPSPPMARGMLSPPPQMGARGMPMPPRRAQPQGEPELPPPPFPP